MSKELTEEQKIKNRLANKLWREKNKEKLSEYDKKRRPAKKDLLTEEEKLIKKELNKQKRKERDNLRSKTEKRKEYREKYQKEYIEKNREQLREKANIRTKNRKNNDSLFNLTISVRKMVWRTLKIKSLPKTKKSEELLGCSFKDFKIYLESKFESWMNWDNYGNPKDGIFEPNKSWDIDHIIPLSSAINEEELLKLCYFENLQPLCSFYNRRIKKDNF